MCRCDLLCFILALPGFGDVRCGCDYYDREDYGADGGHVGSATGGLGLDGLGGCLH